MFTLTIYFNAVNVSVEFVLIYRPHPVLVRYGTLTICDATLSDVYVELCYVLSQYRQYPAAGIGGEAKSNLSQNSFPQEAQLRADTE